MTDWQALEHRLDAAIGADATLDAEIAAAFEVAGGDYSAAPDKCRTLVAAALPGWRLHVGFGANGIFPYAALVNDSVRVQAEAPTVPLAILRAAVAAERLAPAASPAPSAPPPA